MTPAELREQHIARALRTCKHFTGVAVPTCRAGVRYEDVKDSTGPRPFRWPCTSPNAATTCAARCYPTHEEAAAEWDDFERLLADREEKLSRGLCPRCSRPVEPRRQVGRCIYGACGCRLGQGRLR
jgi:hypothetical protein